MQQFVVVETLYREKTHQIKAAHSKQGKLSLIDKTTPQFVKSNSCESSHGWNSCTDF